MNVETQLNSGANYSEEIIPLQRFTTSDKLKGEIRRRIQSRKAANWKFIRLYCQGQFIHLLFEMKTA